MGKISVITGSARPNSVNQAVVELVRADLAAREGVTVEVADLVALELPFVDSVLPPSQDVYVASHDSVKNWGEMVTAADGVVFVAPEYNGSLSGIQKNAIDWLYKEWIGKPAAFVGYSWHAAANSYAAFLAVNNVIKLDLGEKFAGLQFMQDLNPDGSLANGGNATEIIKDSLDELVEKLK